MKPSIPEIGIVIKTKGNTAIVMLKGGEACKGCGQAKIGLCNAANTNMMLAVNNYIGANIGDKVVIGIDKRIKVKGYFFAFIIPMLSLILGALIGNAIGRYFSISSLDVLCSFAMFLSISFFSFRRLKSLDSFSSMTIKSVTEWQCGDKSSCL